MSINDTKNDNPLRDKNLEKQLTDQTVDGVKGAATDIAVTGAVTAIATGGDPEKVGGVMGAGLASAGTGMATSTLNTAINDNQYTNAALNKLPPAVREVVKHLMSLGASFGSAMAQAGVSIAMQKALLEKSAVAKKKSPKKEEEKKEEKPTEKKVEGTQNTATSESTPKTLIYARILIAGRYLVENFLGLSFHESYGNITEVSFTIDDGILIDTKKSDNKTNSMVLARNISLIGLPVSITIYDANKTEEDELGVDFLLYIKNAGVQHEYSYVNDGSGRPITAPVTIKARSICEYLNSGPTSTFFHETSLPTIVKETFQPILSNFPDVKLLTDFIGSDSNSVCTEDREHRYQETPYYFVQRLLAEKGEFFYTIGEYIVCGLPHYAQSKYRKNKEKLPTLKHGIDYTQLNISTEIRPINARFNDHSTATTESFSTHKLIDPGKAHPLLSDPIAQSQQLYHPAYIHGVGGHSITQEGLQQMQEVWQKQNALEMVSVSFTTHHHEIQLCDEITIEFDDHNEELVTLHLRCIGKFGYLDGHGLYHAQIECMLL